MKKSNIIKISSLLVMALYLYNPQIATIGFMLVVIYGLYEIEKFIKQQKGTV